MSASPTPARVQRITPDNPPVFPCWLWALNTTDERWEHHISWAPVGPPQDWGWTHWHPDQLEAPTERPDAPATPSPTPETDAKLKDYNGPLMTIGGVHFIPADFARNLERERDEARRERDSLHEVCDAQKGVVTTCDQLRAELAEARRDTERLDWLEGELRNMDSTRGGSWVRIGDNGRLQIHRIPTPHHATETIWHDEICTHDSIPEYPCGVRQALSAARKNGGAK